MFLIFLIQLLSLFLIDIFFMVCVFKLNSFEKKKLFIYSILFKLVELFVSGSPGCCQGTRQEGCTTTPAGLYSLFFFNLVLWYSLASFCIFSIFENVLCLIAASKLWRRYAAGFLIHYSQS